MSDFSDVDILSFDDDFYFDRNNRNDDLLDSSEDEDPTVLGMRAIKRARCQLERDRRDHQTKLYCYLQEVILNGQPRRQTWKRINTVTRALKICEDLKLEESRLLAELELHMQENWKLKSRIAYLRRKKKDANKSVRATLTRRVSSLTLTPPKLTLPEKRRVSMDDTKITDLSPSESTPSKNDVKSEVQNVNIPKPRRRLKKRTGLTEEEKEFFAMHEKIDDLLYQVDCIWEDVKDDEEFKEEEFLPDDHKKPISDIIIKPEMPKLLPIKTRGRKALKKNKDNSAGPKFISSKNKDQSAGPKTISSRNTDNSVGTKSNSSKNKGNPAGPKFISLTDINKLINPQFAHPESSSKSHPSKIKLRISSFDKKDSSEDEDKLVIDEEGPPKRVNDEMDLIEALQAVDNLCRTIIPDVDDPPSDEYEVKTEPKKRPTRKTRNSKPASDVIVIEE